MSVACLAAATSAQAQSLKKTGQDLGPNTISAGGTAAGNTARYVISLSPKGATTAFTLTDTLPAGVQYLGGTTMGPPGVVPSWSVDGTSFSTTEPSPASGVTKVQFTAPEGTMLMGEATTFPAPPSSSFASAGTGGDGFRVIPYNGKIYTVHHHTSTLPLFCADMDGATTCSGFTGNAMNVPLTAGSDFLSSGSSDFFTSGQFPEYLDRPTGKLYFFAASVDTGKPLVVCANLLTNKSCGSYEFSSAAVFFTGGSPSNFISDGGTDGTRLYGNTSDGKMLCFDTASFDPAVANSGLCQGTPAAGTAVSGAPSSATSVYFQDNVLQVGNRLYWQIPASDPTINPSIFCFDMSTVDGVCSGYVNAVSPARGDFMPTATSGGVADGFCLARAGNASSCYDLNGVSVTTKGDFLTYLNAHVPHYVSTGQAPTFGTGALVTGPAVASSRTVWESATDMTDAANRCWDWVTGAACTGAGFNTTLAPYSGDSNSGRFYEAVADPDNSVCVWTLGDAGQIRSFNSIDGGPCQLVAKVVMPPLTPRNNYCDGNLHALTWAELNIVGAAINTDFTTVKVTLRGADGAVLQDWDGALFTTLPITINLPVSDNTSSLSATVELLNVVDSEGSPFKKEPRPYVTLEWSGDAPQACFNVTPTCEATAPLVNTVSGTFDGVNVSAEQRFTSVSKSSCPVPPGSSLTPVPTLGFYGLLGLMLSILGAVGAMGWRRHRGG